MTRKTRTILFLFLLVLFLLVAPLTVLYCLGWRFNWETKKIIQPGVFYFKVWPKNSQIYLDNKLIKKTDFFFGSALIENLLPKKYDVEIKKEGFHNWEKNLEIKERQVTEGKNIVLIPENPNFTIISEKTEEFFFSPDNKKIILKEKANTTGSENSNWLSGQNPDQGWALKLLEIEKRVKSHLIKEEDISPARNASFSDAGGKEEVQLIDLKFSSDSKRVLLEIKTKEKLSYYLLEIDKVPAPLTPLDFPDIEKVYFHPKNSQKLFILLALTDKTGQKVRIVSELDLVSEEISPSLLTNIITCSFSNSSIHYLDTSGFLFKTDFSFDQKEKLNIIPFSLKQEADYKIATSNSHIVLQENDILYLFDEDKKSFQKIFEPVKNFEFSPAFKKLVFFNDYEIWVLFLEKKYDQPQKEAGEQLFITRFSEKIDEVFWYTSHYLILNVGNKTKIVETDDRDRINIVDLTEFEETKIFWNRSNKKLYILAEENLYSSEKIAP